MTLDKAPDASYKRALIKKLRQASAKLVELDAAGTSTVDAKTAAERRARAEETIARSLDALDAIGVRASDQEVVNARGSDARAASARDEKRRREGEARRLEDERRAKHARANRAIGKTVKSVSLWRLHSMAKNEGLGDEGEVSRAATETASDAERVDGKSCNAGMWAVAKLAKMVPEGQIGVEAYDGVVKALGRAMNALARRMVDMGEDAMDARAASTTIWSIATILKTKCAAHVDDALLRRAVSGAANRLNTCATTANAQDAANALWGAAKLRKMLHEQCVTALVHVLASGEVRTEEVSSSLWAIATFGGDGWKEAATYAEPLAKRAKDMAKKQPKDWNAQAVANAAWAAGKLATNDPNVELGDAKQLITLLIPIAKNLSLSAQGFAHVMYAAGAVVVDSRMLADCAKFASKGLKTHAATLTGADLAAVVEATHALKLGTSMSDGAQLKMAIINAIERGMGGFDWQTVGRLDFVIDDVFDDDEAQSIREKLNVRGTAVCEESDANRMHIERGSADALLAQEITAPFDELSARVLIVDDKHRLITKRLRRVGWSVSNWQRFSCGDHGTGTSWPETPDEFYAAAMVRAPPTKASLAMILHAVAANVRFGGRIWIYGGITEGIRGVIADLPKGLFERTRLVMHDDKYGVVHCVRSSAQPDKKGKELKKWREKKTLDLSDVMTTEHSVPWVAYPGLFAGGGLDVMTTLLLRSVLPTIERKSKLKVLDYCSGAGQIAAAVRAKAKKSRLWLLDADACALEAAKRNLSDDVEFILSDGWRALEKSDRAFDLILSNPPVHLGLAVDFVPIREFLAGLARRLRRPDGIAYFVAQRYVPVRAIAAGTTADTLKITRQGTDDAKFAVWKCVARGA